ncbi:MAG: hypothetical protein IANPNBLG_04283 [Bryobacteraceae bacterium]|nr:hypothetical protein [Bryobacteraceae bacterium]
MLLDSLKAVGGILLLMAIWFAVQAFLRKRTARHDADVLEDMAHGCGACGHSGACPVQPDSKEEIHQCRP